jgi:hypothetical protein
VPLPFVLMILYSCLYIVVNLANVVCVSSAWTLCATCFTATEAKACYGRLCAGESWECIAVRGMLACSCWYAGANLCGLLLVCSPALALLCLVSPVAFVAMLLHCLTCETHHGCMLCLLHTQAQLLASCLGPLLH